MSSDSLAAVSIPPIEIAPPEERETYRDRLSLYQQAKPYRIVPVERTAQQVSYEEQTR